MVDCFFFLNICIGVNVAETYSIAWTDSLEAIVNNCAWHSFYIVKIQIFQRDEVARIIFEAHVKTIPDALNSDLAGVRDILTFLVEEFIK